MWPLPSIRRRWRIILLCVVLGGAGAVGFSLLQRSQYTASSVLLFRNTGFDQQLFSNQLFLPSADPTSVTPTNIELVSLPIVASRTAAALHLNRSEITSAVKISGVGQTNVAQISATDPSPARATLIANTYARQYVLFQQQRDQSQISAAYHLVERQLASMTPAQRSGASGQTLQSRATELAALAAIQTGNAEVVQPATIPTSPSAPKKKRNALLGTLVGLLLGIGLAFLAERFDRRIRDSSELEAAYGVAVLGNVPISPELADSRDRAVLCGASTKGIELLRARLRYFNVDRDVRSLLITSAMPDEGKTTIALNLALAEVEAGNSKVILVEADLRRPTLAHRLGLPFSPGLSEVLSSNATLDVASRRVHIPRDGIQNGAAATFTILTAGSVPPNPVELVESRAMIDLLTTLSERYDMVIVDTPPTSLFADAIPLMRLVRGVVIVSRVGVTTRDAAHQLREQITKLDVPTLGVVENGASPRQLRYAQYLKGSHATSLSESIADDSPTSVGAETSRLF